jgi:hypothetical protein
MDITKVLHVGLNDLLNLLIQDSLPTYQVKAALLKDVQSGRFLRLLAAWKEATGKKNPHEFQDELLKHLTGEPSSVTEIAEAMDKE